MDTYAGDQYHHAVAHYEALCKHEAFAPYREKQAADIDADRSQMKAVGAKGAAYPR